MCSMYVCLPHFEIGWLYFFFTLVLNNAFFDLIKLSKRSIKAKEWRRVAAGSKVTPSPFSDFFNFTLSKRRLLSFVGGRHVRYVGLDFCFDVRLALIFCAPDLILVGPTTTSRNPSNLQSWHDMSSSLSPRVWKNFQQIPCRKSNGVTLLVSTTPCILGSYIKLDYHKSAQARFPLLTQN